MKQSRFDDDHHNTLSIAELLDSKRHSLTKGNLTRRSLTTNKESEDISNQRGSLETESIAKTMEEEDGKDENIDEKEAENYDDYVLGDKVEEEEEQEIETLHRKKYLTDDERPKLELYLPRTES